MNIKKEVVVNRKIFTAYILFSIVLNQQNNDKFFLGKSSILYVFHIQKLIQNQRYNEREKGMNAFFFRENEK